MKYIFIPQSVGSSFILFCCMTLSWMTLILTSLTCPCHCRPHSRPAYQDVSSHPHYHDNVIHQRQRSTDYVAPRQQAIEHFHHHRQNSDLSEQHSTEYYSHRPPPPPRPYTPREHWQNTESAPAMTRHYPHPQPPPGPGPQYGDPIFAYRDPIYPSMAGKRSVQSLSQTGSAKV